MDDITELMLRSYSAETRGLCSRSLLLFLLNYPMTQRRHGQVVAKLLSNLDYADGDGRLELLNLVLMVVARFPPEVRRPS